MIARLSDLTSSGSHLASEIAKVTIQDDVRNGSLTLPRHLSRAK
jgi:hypothetical protein